MFWGVEVNNFCIGSFQNLGKSCFLANCHSYWPPAWQTNRERQQPHKTTITRTVNLWKTWLWNLGSSWRPRWNPQAETCWWSNKADLYAKCCLSFELGPIFLSMLFGRRWSCAGNLHAVIRYECWLPAVYSKVRGWISVWTLKVSFLHLVSNRCI